MWKRIDGALAKLINASIKPIRVLGKAGTTVLIRIVLTFAVGGVLSFLIWGKEFEKRLQVEVFKLSFEFLLVVVVGGAVSLLYEQFSKEQEQKEKRRDLLRQMHAELLKAYNDAKRIRRALRAHVGYRDGGLSPESRVYSADYKKAMEALIDAQLTFEVYTKRTDDTQLWFASGGAFAAELKKVESYLNKIIDEYEDKATSFVNAPSGMLITELPVLSEFISSLEDAPNFRNEFKYAFRSALEKLYEAELT